MPKTNKWCEKSRTRTITDYDNSNKIKCSENRNTMGSRNLKKRSKQQITLWKYKQNLKVTEFNTIGLKNTNRIKITSNII